MPKRRKLALASIAMISVATVGAIWQQSPAGPDQPPKPVSSTVEVALSGKLARLLIHDGDSVERGQVIANLDTTELRKRLAEVRSELQGLRSQSGFIQPVLSLPGMAGFLPKQMPQEQVIEIVNHESGTVPPPVKSTPPEDPFAQALAVQRSDSVKLHKAAEAVAKSVSELAEAQRARDALRSKQTVAEADLAQAEKKLDSGKSLLDAGAISRNEFAEMQDQLEQAKRAVDLVLAAIAEADGLLAANRTKAQSAQTELESCTNALRRADESVALASSDKQVSSVPPPVKAPVKTLKTAKIVSRRMPLTVRRAAPAAIPVKVLVDEKAMESSEQRIAALERAIAKLQSEIDGAVVRAPVAGVVHVSGANSVTITPTAGVPASTRH